MNSLTFNFNDLTEKDFESLQSALSCDRLDLSELPELLLEMKLKNGIKKKYHDKIKERNEEKINGGKRFYIYIDRKQVTATTYEALIDKLYKIEYSRQKQSLTLDDLYSDWLLWKRDYTGVLDKTLREHTFAWKIFLKNEDIITIPLVDLKVKDCKRLIRGRIAPLSHFVR